MPVLLCPCLSYIPFHNTWGDKGSCDGPHASFFPLMHAYNPTIASSMVELPSWFFLAAKVLHCTRIPFWNKLYVMFWHTYQVESPGQLLHYDSKSRALIFSHPNVHFSIIFEYLLCGSPDLVSDPHVAIAVEVLIPFHSFLHKAFLHSKIQLKILRASKPGTALEKVSSLQQHYYNKQFGKFLL